MGKWIGGIVLMACSAGVGYPAFLLYAAGEDLCWFFGVFAALFAVLALCVLLPGRSSEATEEEQRVVFTSHHTMHSWILVGVCIVFAYIVYAVLTALLWPLL